MTYAVADGGRQAAMLARRRAMAEGGEEEEKEEKAMECTGLDIYRTRRYEQEKPSVRSCRFGCVYPCRT